MSPEAHAATMAMGRPARLAQDIAGSVLVAMLVLFSVWALMQDDGPAWVLDASNGAREAMR